MPGSLEPLDVGVQIPYHFRCPISLELMCDPVTVSTGQTYDRASIEYWVGTGNTTCPVTRSSLTDFTLIPNHTLRRLIQDWCVANRSFGVERIPTPKQPADPASVRSLQTQVSSQSNPSHTRLSAVKRLRGLARDSDKNRSIIGSHNVQESECAFVASQPDRVAHLVSLLFHASIEVRVNSAALIEIVVAGTRSLDLRAQISNVDEIFEGITGILNYPLAYPRALKVGIKALFALCLAKQSRHKAVAAGAVTALIDRLADFEKCDVERALATVELLCRVPAGCAAFAAHALTVPLLVRKILKVSDRATEYAAGALLSLCSAAEQSQREAVSAG
ncbi:U-box domain-containing protein 26 [Vitis vinifera]|uniref:U-box domain-containing protein n=1 Tax=Vitis vinifera TaxID=29760 RepID=A0A438EQ06_VITVI|nr:U-box domain-containing protein 26 [Vitis vinifera]